jgi:serine/threonine protein kinase
MPSSYSDYNNYTIEYGDASKYIYGKKLGEGGFAAVYEAINN